MKKRLISLALAAILLLSAITLPALAETGPLGSVAEQIRVLMTETPNITVTGSAEFYLNSFLFKTARGVIIQDNGASYQEIMLEGPTREGKEITNGYAVSNFDGNCRVCETYHGEDHYSGTCHNPKNALVPTTVFSAQLFRLACLAAGTLDGNPHVTETPTVGGGSRVELTLDEQDMPSLVQVVANLIWQFAAKEYAGLESDNFMPGEYNLADNYNTYTDGILYTTNEIRVNSISLRFDRDADGNLRQVNGEVMLVLYRPYEDPRFLKIVPTFDIGIPGETDIIKTDLISDQLKPLEVYGDLANELAAPLAEVFPEIPTFTETLTHRELRSADDAIAYAKEILSMKAFGFEGSPEDLWWKTVPEDGLWRVVAGRADTDEGGIVMVLDKTGHVINFTNMESGLPFGIELYNDNMDTEEWTRQRHNYALSLRDFIECLNGLTPAEAESMPVSDELTKSAMAFQGLYEYNGNCFMQWCSSPDAANGYRKTVTLQLLPVVRVVQFTDRIVSAEVYPNG